MLMDALRHWIGFGLRIFIGGYFLYAAVPKIIEPLAFATSIEHYGLMPLWMVNAYALVIPWLELLVGGSLVAGYRVRTSSALAGIMLVMFTAAVAWAVLWNLKIDCGCFGDGASEVVSWMKVAKNVGLIAMCGYLVYKPVTAMSLENGLWGTKR
ncbi:MAG: DoxX family protein [Candidatus Kapabacteria bacterium]|nr:DoxX family protein [Candidatus Kapabacteria bacterium]